MREREGERGRESPVVLPTPTPSMASRTRLVGLFPGLLVGTGAGATLSGSSWLQNIVPDLSSRLRAALAPHSASSTSADTAALTASVAAVQSAVLSLERAMRMNAQSSLKSLLFIAPLLAGGGFLVYRYGWERLGWVSLNDLRLGLANVKASVEAMVGCLREELCAQLIGVREKVDSTALAVEVACSDIAEVKSELRGVGESVAAVEARLASVETASKRSAEGVEILVRLVATSSLSAGASPETAARLSRFSELPSPLPSAPLELRHKLSEPGTTLPSPPAAPPPPPPLAQRSAPSYLQSILLQSAGN
eukprot:scaffold222582_cov28-Tisochrysis_lutea.AAC.2